MIQVECAFGVGEAKQGGRFRQIVQVECAFGAEDDRIVIDAEVIRIREDPVSQSVSSFKV